MATRLKDHTFHLSNGCLLAYAEYGDPEGFPVFLFHGLPGSRLIWGLIPDSPFRSGVRLIALDRPGFGRSDYQLDHTLIDWSNNVLQLADGLNLDRFAVLGVSAGGPGALACAWNLPQRLTAVAVIGGGCAYDAVHNLKGMSRINRFFLGTAHRAPALSRLSVRLLAAFIKRNQGKYIDLLSYKLSEVDKRIIARPAIREALIKDFQEAVRQGGQGAADDLIRNHGRRWGFCLSEITTKVYLWYGELDTSIPASMGHYLAKAIPRCKATFIPNAGHLWIIEHLKEVLDTLLAETY